MLKQFSSFLLLLTAFVALAFPSRSVAQCPSGSIGVAAGGCLAGCNLTSLGGPNCTGTTGNVAGQSAQLNIAVPAGCTFTVNAMMGLRPTLGCNSGTGADAGDGMKVDTPTGTKPLQSGAGDATLNDSYTLIGPGTIRITCVANRRDEIVSYTVTSSGATCTACSSTLPIELSAFTAVKADNYVDLAWATLSERDNEWFVVERSEDGQLFELIGSMPGAGNSSSLINYMIRDNYPLQETSYYRLKQIDFNGKFTYSEIRSVTFDAVAGISPNPANDQLTVSWKYLDDSQISLTNAMGQEVRIPVVKSKESLLFETADLPEGIYFLKIIYQGTIRTEKIVISHTN